MEDVEKGLIEATGFAPEHFIKAERNLETLGFFSPASKSLNKVDEKVIKIRRRVNRELQELTITILPSAKYGLPNTLHQDFYRGFQRILSDRLRAEGVVPRHVSFATSELLEAMGMSRRQQSGKWYRRVIDWLKVMHLTGIESKGCIWRADEKKWVSDTVHVFERIVGSGSKLEDGSTADRHHVWLSEWQYENINAKYLLSLNHEVYKSLEKKISKSLFSLLHSWFYVGEGKYRMKYSELCQWLGLTHQTKQSYMMRQLEPSHRELHEKGFLSRWVYEPTRSGDVAIVWYAGEQYFDDRAQLASARRSEFQQLEMVLEPAGQSSGSAETHSDKARLAVKWFHRQLGRNEREPTKAEMSKAESLISKFGESAVRFVAEFAVKEAAKTKFPMRDFGAVALYLDEGIARHRKQEVKEREAKEALADEASRLVNYLYERLGRAEVEVSELEIAAAQEMVLKSGFVQARNLVGFVVDDAEEQGFELSDFTKVGEVIERGVGM